MATQKKYDGTIKKIGLGKVEFLKVTMNLTEKERKSFAKNPELFMTKFMEAHGRVVKTMICDSKVIKNLAKKANSGPPRTITPLTVMKAHVYEPPEHKSITITISGSAKKKK